MIILFLGYMMAGMILGYIANAVVGKNLYAWIAIFIFLLIWNM